MFCVWELLGDPRTTRFWFWVLGFQTVKTEVKKVRLKLMNRRIYCTEFESKQLTRHGMAPIRHVSRRYYSLRVL